MTLRILLDSADIDSWEPLWSLGLFSGITTNPTLLRRAGLPCTLGSIDRLVREALSLGCQELHLQAWGSSSEELHSCAEALLNLGPEQIVVKLPLTTEGLHAARIWMEKGRRITLTACYCPSQALAAAALGATYVAPYLGRIGDLGKDGSAEVIRMQRCLAGVGSSTQLLVASLRSLEEIVLLASAGVCIFTVSPALAQQIWSHPETDKAAARFEQDAQNP
ncbi:MAG: transaldolase family protein [Cyanobium sp.]